MSKKEKSTNIDVFEKEEEKVNFTYFYNKIDWVDPVPIARCFIIAYQNSDEENRNKFKKGYVEKLRLCLLNFKKDISFHTDKIMAILSNLNLDKIKTLIDLHYSEKQGNMNQTQKAIY